MTRGPDASGTSPYPGGETLGPSAGTAGAFSGGGSMLAIMGALMGAVGSFFDAKSRKNQLKSEALNDEFAASTATINSRNAELEAEAILVAGNREAAMVGLRAGQAKGSTAAAIGAAGVQAGVGSAAELQASLELSKQVDMFTTKANAVRASAGARGRAVDFQNQARMATMSAANLRSGAGTISPMRSAFVSLLGGGSQVMGSTMPRGR